MKTKGTPKILMVGWVALLCGLFFMPTVHAQTEKICKNRMFFENMRYICYLEREAAKSVDTLKYEKVLLYKNPNGTDSFVMQWFFGEHEHRDWVPAEVRPKGDQVVLTKIDSAVFNPYTWVDNPVWTKEKYTVNGKEHEVYAFKQYNCHSAFCGSIHSHTKFMTAEFFFSPVYGPLIYQKYPGCYQILLDGNDVAPPKDLILAILKRNNLPTALISRYENDMKLH